MDLYVDKFSQAPLLPIHIDVTVLTVAPQHEFEWLHGSVPATAIMPHKDYLANETNNKDLKWLACPAQKIVNECSWLFTGIQRQHIMEILTSLHKKYRYETK